MSIANIPVGTDVLAEGWPTDDGQHGIIIAETKDNYLVVIKQQKSLTSSFFYYYFIFIQKKKPREVVWGIAWAWYLYRCTTSSGKSSQAQTCALATTSLGLGSIMYTRKLVNFSCSCAKGSIFAWWRARQGGPNDSYIYRRFVLNKKPILELLRIGAVAFDVEDRLILRQKEEVVID